MLNRVPSWALLVAGLIGVGLTGLSAAHNGPFWVWQLTWPSGMLLIVLAAWTYSDRRGWSLAARRRKRGEER